MYNNCFFLSKKPKFPFKYCFEPNLYMKEDKLKLREIETDKAPAAVGPYSQAVIAGNFVFVSGQLPVDPDRNTIVKGGIEEQSKQVFDNIYEILKKVELGFKDVVKVEVYLSDMDDFRRFNEIYSLSFAKGVKPARQVVQVAKLPLDALIEVSCIAVMK